MVYEILPQLKGLVNEYVSVPDAPTPNWFRPPQYPQNIQFICIHTTASWNDKQYKHINNTFFTNYFFNVMKWSKVGYKFLVFANGHVSQFGPFDDTPILAWQEITYGEPLINTKAVHVSWVGGLESVNGQIVSVNNITKEQEEKLWALVKKLLELFPNAMVCGHNQFRNKPCPMFFVPDVAPKWGIPSKNIYKADPYNYRQHFSIAV